MSEHDAIEDSGYLYSLAAAITAGSISPLSKFLVSSVQPLVLAALTVVGAGLVLLPYKFAEVPPRRGMILFLSIGLIGVAIGFILWVEGLTKTTAVNSSLLVNGEAFFTSIIAFAIFSERLNRKQLLSGLLILAGIIVIATNLEAGFSFLQGFQGNLLIIGASAMWGISNNLQRIATQRFNALIVAKFTMLIGGVILIGVVLASQVSIAVPLSSVPYLIVLTIVIVMTTILMNVALARIGAIRAILVFSTTSVFGAIFAMVFLSEQITLIQIAGGAITLLGAYLIQRNEVKVDSPSLPGKTAASIPAPQEQGPPPES